MTVFPALVVPKVPENLSNPKKIASLLLGRWVFTALMKLFILFLLQGIPTHVLCSSHGQATVLCGLSTAEAQTTGFFINCFVVCVEDDRVSDFCEGYAEPWFPRDCFKIRSYHQQCKVSDHIKLKYTTLMCITLPCVLEVLQRRGDTSRGGL